MAQGENCCSRETGGRWIQVERAGPKEPRGEWFEANRANWDERVPIHVGGAFYDVEGFLAGGDRLRPFEVSEVGDVAGKDLLHLQCHFGIDTLSWARRGARVTGLDFSAPAVEAARGLAERTGLSDEARFVEANVYDAVRALRGREFDVVYTGLGALNWLPDVGRWARVAAALVRPGGFLYLAEFHPFMWVFGDDDLTVEHDYFHGPEPQVWDEPGTYADPEAETTHNRTYEWNHPLGDVVSAVAAAGLRVELLHEHDYTLFPRWPFLERSGFDTYRLPEGTPDLPMMYSLRASKPQG
jgi:SAM-dependent methyltransferase